MSQPSDYIPPGGALLPGETWKGPPVEILIHILRNLGVISEDCHNDALDIFYDFKGDNLN